MAKNNPKLTLKKYDTSLLAKVTGITMAGSIVLGLVLLTIGLSLYIVALTGQYIAESYTLARSTATVVKKTVDTESLTKQVMDIYHSMSDEERSDPNSEQYLERFALVQQNEEWFRLKRVLGNMQESSEVDYLYMGVYDEETNTLVYICDPDVNPKTMCQPGNWETPEKDEIQKFLSWDGRGRLYDIGQSARHGYMCTSGYPLENSAGEPYAFILADVTLAGVAKDVRVLALQYFLALAITLFFIGLLMRKNLRSAIVDPINSISLAAQNYVRDRNDGIATTDRFDKLGINTGDEIEHLALIMSDMEHSIASYEAALQKAAAEQEHAHTEMELAARIQMNMLPMKFPAFPDRDEFDIYASMDPAKEVGGDFYDFFLIDEDHLGIVIADVSGKGIPAALFMMASMIIVGNNTLATPGYDAGDMLTAANEVICVHNKMDMFVTVWLGILEISTGKLNAANAGHEYPAIKHADGRYELLKDHHGFVLGAMEGVKYKSYEIQLKPGSKVFVYTDGLPEATDNDNELFGTDRMIDALNTNPSANPETTLKNVRRAVDLFVEDAPQFDDLTMLCLEYKGGHKRTSDKDLKKRAHRNLSGWQLKKEINWH